MNTRVLLFSPSVPSSMAFFFRAFWLILVAALLWGPLAAQSATTLNWAGRTWTLKEGQANPGNNYWSASTNCAWVDANGYLHLQVKYFSNRWYCAELYTTNKYPYGEYRFQVDSSITNLDTNVVAGFFLYNNNSFPSTLGEPEIDIEFARQFKDMDSSHNSSYAVQPTLTEKEDRISTNCFYFRTTNALNHLTTHRFVWTNSQIYYESYTGHGLPGSGSIIAQWTRTSNSVSGIPQENMAMKLYLNCYLFQHKPPSSPQNTEIILRGLSTPAPIPPRATLTNLLEGFEQSLRVLPSTNTFALYDFEKGIPGWRVEWNPSYGFLMNMGNALHVHGGTNSMRIYCSWIGDVYYRHHITNGLLRATNWSGYSKLTYWVKSTSTAPTNKIKVVFFEKSGQYWYETAYHDVPTTWTRFEVLLNRDSLGTDTDDPLDLSDIDKFKFETQHYKSGGVAGDIYVDDVELVEGGVMDYDWHYAGSYSQMKYQSETVHNGSNALEFARSNLEAPGWASVWSTNLVFNNWEDYNKISFWAKRSSCASDSLPTSHLVKIQFIQQDGDAWSAKGFFGDANLPTITTTWQPYELTLDLDSFEYAGSDWTNTLPKPSDVPPTPPGDRDIHAGMTNIYAVLFAFYNPWTNSVNYYVDDMNLMYERGDPQLSLLITNRSIGFSAVSPSPSQYRFVSTNFATIQYQAKNVDLWQLKLYTTNQNNQAGLPGQLNPNSTIPIRAWVGTNAPPSPMDTTSWTGQWSYVNDQYGTVWPVANSLSPLASGFRLYFATDVAGAEIQTYSASVILELEAQ